MEWLVQQAAKIGDGGAGKSFFLAFSAASRFFDNTPLQLSSAADKLRTGFMPHYCNQLQAARTLLLLELPH
jgi:hypothetical protein